jgi:hypothetical protein
MLIFCTPFNQVILNFQISFFNGKDGCLLPEVNRCEQFLDVFSSLVAFVYNSIN